MLDDNVDAIRTLLNQDPIWSAYALADLQPAFAPSCRWLMAQNDDGPGLVLLYAGLTPTILFSTGCAAAVQAGLAQANLPDKVYITIPEAHLPVVAQVYDFSASLLSMWRMVYTGSSPAQPNAAAVERLNSRDAAAIKALYTHGGRFTPDAFDPSQLPDGVFYGVRHGRDLVAVGGTHIVDGQAGIAAIGNMYTRPDLRGQGLAGAVLAAIVGELTDRKVGTIVLNVAQANTAAQRLYTRHGFAFHCSYLEGVGTRRSNSPKL